MPLNKAPGPDNIFTKMFVASLEPGHSWRYHKYNMVLCLTVEPEMQYLCYVVVVCHDQIRCQVSQGSRCRGSQTHESIPPDSAIDPLVTSQLGVW